jgi:hypothetical protein
MLRGLLSIQSNGIAALTCISERDISQCESHPEWPHRGLFDHPQRNKLVRLKIPAP